MGATFRIQPGMLMLRADAGGKFIRRAGRGLVDTCMAHGPDLTTLGAPLRTTSADDYIVRDIEWRGGLLLYYRLPGVRDYDEFIDWESLARNTGPNPYGDYRRYEQLHAQTWAYDPETGEDRVVLPEGSGDLLTGDEHEPFVICNPTYRDEHASGHTTRTHVAIYSALGSPCTARFDVPLGVALDEGRFNGPVTASRLVADAGRPWFTAVGKVDGDRSQYGQRPRRELALAVIHTDGDTRFLTDATLNLYWAYLPGFPTLVNTHDGDWGVACMLRQRGNTPVRLAVYSPEGPKLAEHAFGLRWGGLTEATRRQTNWRPITVTPNGEWLLLQDTGAREAVLPGEKAWVWMWDLQKQIAVPLADIGGITQCFGWLNDEHLIVEVQAKPSDQVPEYGVLHVPWKTVANELAEPD